MTEPASVPHVLSSIFAACGAEALFLTLLVSVLGGGWFFARAVFPETQQRPARAAAWALIAYAGIIIPCTILGAIGHLRSQPLVFASLIFFCSGFIFFLFRNSHPLAASPACENINAQQPERLGLFAIVLLCLAAPCAILVFLWGVLTPPPPWDAFVYHLPFAATWLQHGAISIITVPFGDQAGAYFPSNTELYFLWLMLPFHSELLTNAAQFPFYILIGYLAYACGREVGIGKNAAAAAAALCLLLPGMMQQATGAEVDIIFAALFLLSLYFYLLYLREGTARCAALSGLAAGLFAGTKYIGLTFLAPFALIVCATFIARKRPKHLAPYFLCALLAGGYWYMRNFAVTGNPIFPLTISLFGIEIFPGGYPRSSMMYSVFHAKSAREWFDSLVVAPGMPLGILCSLGAPAVLLAGRRINSWILNSIRLLAVIPCLMLFSYTFLIPYNKESRFTYAAWALACLCAAAFTDASSRGVRFAARCAVLCCAVAALTLNNFFIDHVKMLFEILFTRGGRWIGPELAALMRPGAWMLLIGIGISFLGVLLISRRTAEEEGRREKGEGRREKGDNASRARASGALCLAGGFLFLALTPAAILPAYRNYRHAYAPGFFTGHAWQYLDLVQQRIGPDPAHIAFTGTDLCFGLFGRSLENSVYSVPVHRHIDWKFHDCVRDLKQRGQYTVPRTDRIDFCRRGADARAWIRNLAQRRTDFVFISVLHQNDRPHLDHDAGGFPIERAWADAHPEHFRLIYPTPRLPNPHARIYRFSPRALP